MNPYHQFLGLPEAETAPDHYALLGLPRFTDDAKLIHAAAIARNSQLKAWDNSRFYREANALLGEVVNAAMILEDPRRKSDYDRELRASLGLADEVARPRDSISAAEPVETPAPEAASVEPASSPRQIEIPVFDPPPEAERRPAVPLSPARQPVERDYDRLFLQIAAGVIGVGALAAFLYFGLPDIKRRLTPAVSTGDSRPAPRPAPDEGGAANEQQRWATSLQKPVTVSNRVGMTFRFIPPGEFQMRATDEEFDDESGSNSQHSVRITRPLYFQTTEVTQGQWKGVMSKLPWTASSGRAVPTAVGDEYPVVLVSWEEAVAFCERLSAREGVEYRLPTEAEWEYACRAGTDTRFSFGDDEKQLGDYACFIGNSRTSREGGAPSRVGLKRPNAWGLFDMHGNVWEFCLDHYSPMDHARYEDTVTDDPQGPVAPLWRVMRGGAYHSTPSLVRSWYREPISVSASGRPTIGFRVVYAAGDSVAPVNRTRDTELTAAAPSSTAAANPGRPTAADAAQIHPSRMYWLAGAGAAAGTLLILAIALLARRSAFNFAGRVDRWHVGSLILRCVGRIRRLAVQSALFAASLVQRTWTFARRHLQPASSKLTRRGWTWLLERWRAAEAASRDPQSLFTRYPGRLLQCGVVLAGVTPALHFLQQISIYLATIGERRSGSVVCLLVILAPLVGLGVWLVARKVVDDEAGALFSTIGVLIGMGLACALVRYCGKSAAVLLTGMLIAKGSLLLSGMMLTAAMARFLPCPGTIRRLALAGTVAFGLSASALLVLWIIAPGTLLWLPGTEGALLARSSVLRTSSAIVRAAINLEGSVDARYWDVLTLIQAFALGTQLAGALILLLFVRRFRDLTSQEDALSPRIVQWGLATAALFHGAAQAAAFARFQHGGRILTNLNGDWLLLTLPWVSGWCSMILAAGGLNWMIHRRRTVRAAAASVPQAKPNSESAVQATSSDAVAGSTRPSRRSTEIPASIPLANSAGSPDGELKHPGETSAVVTPAVAAEPAAAAPDVHPVTAAAVVACPECSKALPPGARICTDCGFDLRTGQKLKSVAGTAAREAEQKAVPRVCPVCGKRLLPKESSCPQCFRWSSSV